MGSDQAAGKRAGGVHYEKRERSRSIYASHALSGKPDGVAVHYTCPTTEDVHWANPSGRPQHWHVKGHVPSHKEKKKEEEASYNGARATFACLASLVQWSVANKTLEMPPFCCANVYAVVQLVEYRTCNREVAGSTHTRSTTSNLEQVANLLCAQANSASYPQRDGKRVVSTATGWRPSVADWGDGVSASCTVGPIVR